MTEFRIETRIPYRIDDVFLAYRDRLPELAPFIPNVKGIEVLERKEEPGVVRLLNRWRAKAEVPGPLKGFITEDKLSWLDRAVWQTDRTLCHWDLEITAFKDAVRCRGETVMHNEGTHTRMVIAGDLTVDVGKVGLPIPRMLAGGLGKAVEAFAVALIKPNQEAIGKALDQFLTNQGKGR